MAAAIVHEDAGVEPAPADDLQVSEVGLPYLVRLRCLVPEFISGRQNYLSRTGNQVVGLEDAIPVRQEKDPLDRFLIRLTL